ncbi:MAG: putative rane protein [Actinomycetota bacterium]|jgi:putative membrane protein|nr:putative rane protein [Actinomycetota bacterium]
MSRRLLSTAGAGAVSAALLIASPIGAAAASSNEPAIVVNRETVQAELNPSGSVDTARLFSQLVVTGDGTYKVFDPTSGKNIRDLDGFSAPSVKNGMANYTIDVHGRTSRRTVSDFTGKLPITVQAEYTLDGKRMSAQDIVGKSGILDVQYTVENVSATPTQISFTVAGKKVTKTVDLVTPYVGQLSLTLGSSFTDIDATRADIGGDGRGGQVLNWTMVLFEPIGQVKQRFGYTARVKHAQLPAATIQAVPVSPNKKPELAYGEKGFADGVDSAGNVAFAGATIDSNMIKLRDGAGDLLAGLTKLAAGAAALKDGLAGSAAPGAHQLADGLGQAKAGSTKLAAGADKLGGGLQQVKAGSGKLSAGLGTASAGSEKLLDGSQDLATGAGLTAAGAKSLSDGLAQISGGLDQLGAASALPAAKAGAVALRAGVDKLLAGLGNASTPGTILNGMAQISGGVSQLGSQVQLGLDNPTDPANPGTKQAVQGLQQLSGLQKLTLTTGIPANALGAGSPAVPGVKATLGCGTFVPATALEIQVATACGVLDTLLTNTSFGFPKTDGTLVSMLTGIADAQTKLGAGVGALSGGVGQVQAGLLQIVGGLKSGSATNPGLAEGLDALVAGLTTAVGGVTQLSAGAKAASTGSVALADGTAKVAAGAAKLSGEGASPLAAGLSQLYAGSKALDDGLGQLATGGGQAVAGVHAIDDGLTKLYAGGTKLADGLDAAADGSGQLADGLNQAKAGNVQIHDGVEALRTQAAVPLTTAGEAVAASYAERYATMQALDEKGADGALPYGAPEGASGSAVYQLTLAAATTHTRDNTTRGLVAIVLLGLASLSGFVVRRRVLR